MSGVFHAIFGGGNDDGAEQAQIAEEQAQLRQQQGQQLKLLTQQQAKSDSETAGLSQPGLGRAMLAYNKKTGTAGTLGG